MRLVTKKRLSSEIEGRCLAAMAPSWRNLIWLSALLFSGTLSRQGLLGSALRARLQVIGVALHFSDDVLCLNLALEATEGVFY
jgi:hypothetical protein